MTNLVRRGMRNISPRHNAPHRSSGPTPNTFGPVPLAATCPMPIPPLLPLPTTGAAVLLVLLPLVGSAGVEATQRLLAALQCRLGAAIRVLVVEEASHPDVVRSFQPAALPACVLVQRGQELWRQPGLPEGELVATQLLRLVAGAASPGAAT